MFSGLVIHVIDPLNRTGKVAIPAHHVTDTKGLEDYRTAAANHESKDFSLCLLFQKGRCNAGTRCHQVHASPEFVTELRARAAANKNCCAEHGDMHSCGYCSAPQTIVIVPTADAAAGGEQEKRYPVSCFARTAALDNVLRVVKSLEVRVPASKLCRLHGQRRCKFGKDCKNVHLCPDAVELPSAKKPSCASVDNNTMSCGVSCRSGSHPASAIDSPAPGTPRDGVKQLGPLHGSLSAGCAPLPLDVDCHHCAATGSLVSDDRATSHGCSSFFFSDERMWGSNSETAGEASIMSCALDMSAFEATIRNLCADLDRAEVSPACASRVRSQGQLLADLQF